MNNIYIFGHKRPDTDSVCSAITLSYLKNMQGYTTTPYILGDINPETKFVLNYFNIKVPKLLDSVKLQIKDINYHRNCYINYEKSVLDAYNYMVQNNISSVPVIDENKKFDGVFSMKDIARNFVLGNTLTLDTSYDHIVNGLDGKQVLKFDEKINGQVVSTSYRSTTFIEQVAINHDTILITGDRHSIIEFAIDRKVQLIIITNGLEIKEEFLKKAAENRINIITTNQNSFYVASHIALTNYIKALNYSHTFLCFKETDNVDDLVDIMNKSKYSYYPIIDEDNTCLGILKTVDLNDKKAKQVILVDHQEFNQSVDGIEEAEILEIIDHHKIGTTQTFEPISFLNRPIGSTNTIIYQLYKDNNINIPKNIAGLMMASIISDTLLLKSPTTTFTDKKVLEELSELTGINYEEFGTTMIKAGASLKGKTIEEVIYNDYKTYEINNKRIGIGQISTLNAEEILSKKEKYITHLNHNCKNNDLYINTLFITDILKNGSYILFNDSIKSKLEKAFDQPLTQGSFIENCISRKKQIVPKIMSIIEK